MAPKRLVVPLSMSILCLAIAATSAHVQSNQNPIVYAQDGTNTFAMVNGQMIPIPPDDSSMFSSVKKFFKIDWSNNAVVRSLKNLSSYFSPQSSPQVDIIDIQSLPSSHHPQYATPNGQPLYRPNNLQYQEPPKPQQPQLPQLPHMPQMQFNPYPQRPVTFETLPPQQLRGPQLQVNPEYFTRLLQQQQQQPAPQYPPQPRPQPPPALQYQQPMMTNPSAHQMPIRPPHQQPLKPMSDFAENSMPGGRSNIIKIPGGIEVITHEMPADVSLNSIASEPFQSSNEIPLDDAYHSSVVEPMPSRQSQQQQTDPTDTEFEGDNPCPVVGQWKWDGTYCIALGPMPRWACKPTDLVPTGRLAVCRNRIAYPNESAQEKK